MALLSAKKFDRLEKERYSIHKPAAATFSSYDIGGVKYVQIDTYGTKDRVMPEKVSQSIQIDKEMAIALITVLKQEFNI